MKKSRFNETQIVSILQQQQAGLSVADICRAQNISEATFYKWKARYGGMQPAEIKRLQDLEAENRKLKLNVRRTKPGQPYPERGTGKKVVEPEQRKSLAEAAIVEHQISTRRVYRLFSVQRSRLYYRAVDRPEDASIIVALQQLVSRYRSIGFWGCYRLDNLKLL